MTAHTTSLIPMRLLLALVFALALTACDSGPDVEPQDLAGDYSGTYTRRNAGTSGSSQSYNAELRIMNVDEDGRFTCVLALNLSPAPYSVIEGEGQIDGSQVRLTLSDGSAIGYTALSGTFRPGGVGTVTLTASRGDTYEFARVAR